MTFTKLFFYRKTVEKCKLRNTGTGIAMQLRIICTIEKTHRYRYFICSTGTVPVAMKFLNKYGAVTAYALILNLSKSAENVFLQVVTFQR
jgi:hypothetical protein